MKFVPNYFILSSNYLLPILVALMARRAREVVVEGEEAMAAAEPTAAHDEEFAVLTLTALESNSHPSTLRAQLYQALPTPRPYRQLT
jgi:hypothetical protein